jgi:hypothetical protein
MIPIHSGKKPKNPQHKLHNAQDFDNDSKRV